MLKCERPVNKARNPDQALWTLLEHVAVGLNRCSGENWGGEGGGGGEGQLELRLLEKCWGGGVGRFCS